MYLPRSYFSDIGDVEVIEHGGQLHMFHLVLPNRDLIAHAVSDDGLSWRAVEHAITTGTPGNCDDDMIRTVSVTERDGQFYMLYTATSRADAGRREMAALALSDDLYHWVKHQNNPVAVADPRFYQTELGVNNSVSFRDPKPFYEDGVYHCLVCSRAKEGMAFRRGSAAHLVSQDLKSWKSCPPLFTPGTFDELECPQLYRIGAYYYLFASIIEEGSQRYWMSKNLEGPYLTPPNTVMMPPGSHYAARVCQFGGKHILACWTSCRQDGPSPYGLRETPGEYIRYVPAILELAQQPDGTLQLHSTDNWTSYCLPTDGNALTGWRKLICCNDASYGTDTDSVSLQSQTGYSLILSREVHQAFTLSASLRVTGNEAGIAFAVSDQGEGYFLRILPYLHRVELLCHASEPDRHRFIYKVLQHNHLPDTTNKEFALLLRQVNGEIEVSLNGQVVLSTVSTTCTEGRIGLFSDCGGIVVEQLHMTPMKLPFNR